MLIICPNCSNSYLIRASEIGAGGRLVRCNNCQQSWHVEAPDLRLTAAPDDETELSDKQDEITAFSPHTPRRTNRRMAIGGLAIAALASAVVLPIGKIADVARALIGRVLPADPYAGLDFDHVTSQLVAEDEQIVLVVEGQIIAKSGENRAVPGLSLTIRGEGNDQIFRWTVKPPAETISTGAPIPFKVRLASPPITGREVLIRFVDTSEVEEKSAS